MKISWHGTLYNVEPSPTREGAEELVLLGGTTLLYMNDVIGQERQVFSGRVYTLYTMRLETWAYGKRDENVRVTVELLDEETP